MFPGERLRADLRDLQRLCLEIGTWIGLEADAKTDVIQPVVVKLAAHALDANTHVNADLLQAVHERTLLAVGMLLRAMESIEVDSARHAGNSRWVSRPAVLGAAQVVALLWAQVRLMRQGKAGTAAGTAGTAGDAGDGPRPDGAEDGRRLCEPAPMASRATQTPESCLWRCQSCCTAEAAVKALVEVFCSKLDEPSVAAQRSAVAAGLCHLSQWAAMRALTCAVAHDLDALLRERDQARDLLGHAREQQRDAQEALRSVTLQLDHARAEEHRALDRVREVREELASTKLAMETRLAEVTAMEQARLQDLARLRQDLDEARGREADLRHQLQVQTQATTAALDEANGQRRQFAQQAQQAMLLDGELQQSRQQAEALQVEQTKLRKQVKLAEERHALLLRYPDLHGPLSPLQHEAGDPVLDMECQVRANEVRVSLLTNQNERLRATIAKLRVLAASGRPPTRNHSRPTSASSPSPSGTPMAAPSSPSGHCGAACSFGTTGAP